MVEAVFLKRGARRGRRRKRAKKEKRAIDDEEDEDDVLIGDDELLGLNQISRSWLLSTDGFSATWTSVSFLFFVLFPYDYD